MVTTTATRRDILRSPVSPAEVAATRLPTMQASTLPARVYHDPAVFQFEVDAWFRKEWLYIAREEDLPEVGSYIRREVLGENIIIVRGLDEHIRAFYNVCRHRGATIVDQESGRTGGFSCPYHAWTYDLQGQLRQPGNTDRLENFRCEDYGLLQIHTATWGGHVFINLDENPHTSFGDHLGDFRRHFDRHNLHELKRVRAITYDVESNWKALVENYSECYHCPGVHPLLNSITPADMRGGIGLNGTGQWRCGSMVMDKDYETLSTDGYLHGRPVFPTMTQEDLKHVYYAVIWPNMLFSIHPDFLMNHQVWPVSAERSIIVCEFFFHPNAIEQPDFDPSGSIEFWDITNVEDWRVCERQQQGTKARNYVPGRYANWEGGVHHFDVMCADRYAQDGKTTELPRTGRFPEDDHLRISADD
jgi:Rieske 2Fe-2S family protein